jgi:hypothetical protein
MRVIEEFVITRISFHILPPGKAPSTRHQMKAASFELWFLTASSFSFFLRRRIS